MFNNLIKELNHLQRTSISVPIITDAKGYIDKQCPSEECEFLFKVNNEDWKNIFNDETVFCPQCKHEAPSNEWFTIDQIEHGKSEALTIVKGKISNALYSGAQKFNRRQPKNSFISVSLKVQGGRKRTFALPAAAVEEMRLEIKCEECNARFAVIGSAYFCPACGHNSVTQTYMDSLRKIRAKKNNIDNVKQSLIEVSGKDDAILVSRSMLESCISDGVVAFQKYCEGLYEDYGKAPFNAFQRIAQGSKLWASATGKGYDTWLTTNELRQLTILFQKRHLLAHQDGIVDIKYIEKTGDTNYKTGQRIVVTKRDIDMLLNALEKLGEGLKANRGVPS